MVVGEEGVRVGVEAGREVPGREDILLRLRRIVLLLLFLEMGRDTDLHLLRDRDRARRGSIEHILPRGDRRRGEKGRRERYGRGTSVQ